MPAENASGWTPLGFLGRSLKALVGMPSRGGGASPDHSWVEAGRPAEAVVTSAERTNRLLSDPPSHWWWVVQLHVRPPDGAEFDVMVEDWFRVRTPPVVGGVVHVVYDPTSADRTIIDHRSDADREAGIGRPGRANDDETLANAEWAATAGPSEVLRGTIRAFRRKAEDLRGE